MHSGGGSLPSGAGKFKSERKELAIEMRYVASAVYGGLLDFGSKSVVVNSVL